jgi:trigger factor
MQVVVESVSALGRRLKISVPASRLEQTFNNRLNQTARTVKMDGFRQGKVPLSLVKKRFGESIRAEALEDVIRDSYVAAVESQSLRVAGFPTIEPFNAPEGKDLEFSAVVEVYPEITIGDFSAIAVERPTAEVTEADVDEMITNLRRQRAKFADTEEASVQQDRVTLDFEGTVDGEAFAGNSAKDFNLVLGSGRMIPGFEDQIVGMKAGDEKVITVTFPADYQAENLAGKEAKFSIKVSKVSRPELPELDDQFLAAFGTLEGGVDKFRADVRKNMERELRNSIRGRVKSAAFDALLAANPVELPKALVDQEIDRQRQQAIQRFGGNAQNIKPEMLPNQLFEEASRRSVALGLLIGEIINKNEVKVDADRVKTLIGEIAESYEDPAEVVAWYMGNREQRAQVESAVLEDQVVDLILASAQISDKAVSYSDLLRQQQ